MQSLEEQSVVEASAGAGAGEGTRRPRRPRVMPDVVRALAFAILSGRYPPGCVLPRESDLGAEYNVSRTVIREALKVLAAKGLVVSRPRVGTSVCETESWNILDPQVVEWHGPTLFDRRLLDAVIEARKAIEPFVAGLAAQRASLRELADLESAWQGMADAGDDVALFSQSDMAFHRILYQASHNPVFRQIGMLIDAALKYSVETSNSTVAKRDEAVGHHRAVVEALRMRDVGAAEQAAVLIIEQAAHDIETAARKLNEGAGRTRGT